MVEFRHSELRLTCFLLICYLHVDRLMKLQQLLTPTSFQWSSSLFLNILKEVDVTTLLGSLFHRSITLWMKKFWRTCRVDLGFDSFKVCPLRWLHVEDVKNWRLATFSLSVHILNAIRWIFSRRWISFWRYGDQAWIQNSIWGLTYVVGLQKPINKAIFARVARMHKRTERSTMTGCWS